jgi:hypothetical protein
VSALGQKKSFAAVSFAPKAEGNTTWRSVQKTTVRRISATASRQERPWKI